MLFADAPFAGRRAVVLVLDLRLSTARDQRRVGGLVALEGDQGLSRQVDVDPAFVRLQIDGQCAGARLADLRAFDPAAVPGLRIVGAAELLLLARELDGRKVVVGFGGLDRLAIVVDGISRDAFVRAEHEAHGQLPLRRGCELDAFELRARGLPKAIAGRDQAASGLVPRAVVPTERLVDRYVEARDHAFGEDVVGVFGQLIELELVHLVLHVVALPPRLFGLEKILTQLG